MNNELKTLLNQCLSAACLQCTFDDPEEHGGFIIKKLDDTGFEFHLVRNQNEGRPRAVVLYAADVTEHYKKVRKKTEARNPEWVEYATFHTHPKGCEPHPSKLDLQALFTSSPINYIYSPTMRKLMEYTYDNQNQVWLARQIQL